MRLVVGLGNPGMRYARTRHNAGFMVVEEVATQYEFQPWRQKFQGRLADGQIGGTRVFVLEPLTFMNLAGQSVGEALRFHRLLPEDVIVIHDDIDLAFGRIKIKQGGGTGGHNGLRSLDQHITPNYWRVRFGVGHPGHRDLVENYVLESTNPDTFNKMQEMATTIAKHIALLIEGDSAGFLSKLPQGEV